jgi:hypothetical protein
MDIPVPWLDVTNTTTDDEFCALERSYDTNNWCADSLTFDQRLTNDAIRYKPFETLTEYHSYWWAMTTFRFVSLAGLAIKLAMMRYRVNATS